jgi:spermidine synthase
VIESAKGEFACGTADRPDPEPNFDGLAAVYRWMEWLSFGPFLGRARCVFLPSMIGARRALVLGDGDGRFTQALLRTNPAVAVDAVDVSRGMLQSLLRAAGADAGRVRVKVQNAATWTPDPAADYDIVATHFFLDCLRNEDVLALAERVRPSLAPQAQWVVSEFAVPANSFGRWVARPVVQSLYWAFRVMTGLNMQRLPNWQAALRSAGFALVEERQWLHGLLTSQLWKVTAAAEESA